MKKLNGSGRKAEARSRRASGLIPLAGALGAGTIFALFFGGHRRAGFAVFEVFIVVAVLSAVATTAYFCIALLLCSALVLPHGWRVPPGPQRPKTPASSL